jgi:hypothetical protein
VTATAQITQSAGKTADLTPARLAMRERVRGGNIDETTLLATDYLNHFNEVTMLLEMVADMPDLLDEVKAWQPKTYAEHFRDSGLSIADMAIEAYALSPGRYRMAFDGTVEQMNEIVLRATGLIERAVGSGNDHSLREAIASATQALQSLNERASGIIHGKVTTASDIDIDGLLAGAAGTTAIDDEDGPILSQAAIDALFD